MLQACKVLDTDLPLPDTVPGGQVRCCFGSATKQPWLVVTTGRLCAQQGMPDTRLYEVAVCSHPFSRARALSLGRVPPLPAPLLPVQVLHPHLARARGGAAGPSLLKRHGATHRRCCTHQSIITLTSDLLTIRLSCWSRRMRRCPPPPMWRRGSDRLPGRGAASSTTV